jgi:isoleucyl-tRNA synthetase
MSQKGYQITYQIGFDCHGLPLEQEAEKTVSKVSPNDSLENLTIFNNECRKIISNCSEVWYETLGQLGRQFDKSQTYKTCDLKFMESLWWAFKKLWNDDLIYQSKKVMPYSPKCETPLSNFEAGSNYQERTDISVYVKFKLLNSDESLLIWTTTPWSLFANQGICVNGEFDYQLVELSTDTNKEKLWVAKDFVEKLFNDPKYTFEIIKTVKGITLVGLQYQPIFPINNYNDRINLFKTIKYVDYIILYDECNITTEQTLDEIMQIVDPYFWVKGSDYKIEEILKKHPCLKNIKLIDNIENKSTTNIIKKISNKN